MYQMTCDLSNGLVPCCCLGSSSLGCPKYFVLSSCQMAAVASLTMVWMGDDMVMNGDVKCDGKRYVGHSKFYFMNTEWHLPLFGSPPL